MRYNTAVFIIFLLFVLNSCKQAKLSDAREKYAHGHYHAAGEIYRKLYRNSADGDMSIRGVLAYEMAEANRMINRSSRAVSAYRSAIRYGYPDSLLFLKYAQMLHREGEYKLATDAYNEFLKLDYNNILAINGIKGAQLSIEWLESDTDKYIVEPAEIFNSTRGEFGPVLTNNDNSLYLSSSRNDATGEIESPVTGMKYNDLFISKKNVKGEWQKPERLNTVINSEFDEGTPSFSSNGRFMFYTYSDSYKPNNTKIFISRRINGIWSAGREIEFVKNDSLSIFAHPAISPSGEYLYFVSDMPGGFGGKDIWRARMTLGFNPISIENLGPIINSSGDELFPYLRNDTTLYYSSNGLPGMGGLDIFEAHFTKNNDKWVSENLGPPINSSHDDFGITFKKGVEKGFFSSNRNDIRGYDHIYSFSLPDISIAIEGIVVNPEDDFIDEATILVVGSDGAQRTYITKKDGEYGFKGKAGINYHFTASAEGYLSKSKLLNVPPNVADTLYYVDFEMIPYNKPIVLENVFYNFNSASIRDESIKELNKLVDFLKEYPKVGIELKSHTDRVGSEKYNINLSFQRAQTIIDFLLKKGVDKERVTANGVGKSEPKKITPSLAAKYEFLNDGDILTEEFIEQLTAEQQDIADQINRRTEFIVSDFQEISFSNQNLQNNM